MKLNSLRNSVLVVLLFLVACNRNERVTRKHIQEGKISTVEQFTEPDPKFVKEKQQKIHKFFKENMGSRWYNGQFLVAKNGKVIYFKAQGSANFRKKEPMTATTPVHVASVSKVATALAVLRLVDQKKIILDKDVRRYLHDFPYEGVTVRMLLNHRSGVPYYGYFTFNTWHLGKTLYNSDILALLKQHKFRLNFPPDRKFAYCNTNYALLALIVEKVTGHTFPRAMKDLIFDPLSMNNSFILNGKWQFKKVSQSYNSKHQTQQFDYLDAIYGDKNLYTTALDLLKLDKATYSKEFLSDSLREQMFKGYSYERSGKNNYGLGIRVKEMEGRNTLYFHTGWWHGNTACYSTLRQDTVCIIAISNVYTRSVYQINRLSMEFGNYPYEPLNE